MQNKSNKRGIIWCKKKNNKRLNEPMNVNVNDIVISDLIETKTNSKYLIGYLDKVVRPLVLILPKMSV